MIIECGLKGNVKRGTDVRSSFTELVTLYSLHGELVRTTLTFCFHHVQVAGKMMFQLIGIFTFINNKIIFSGGK